MAMPLEGWIQNCIVARFLYDWQTLAAGLFALLAAIGTIWVTRSTASRQIDAAREQADRMVAAAREQTSVTAEQTSKTIYLARMREAGESAAFHTMLAAAMARILAETASARSVYPDFLTKTDGSSIEALAVRNCITKGAFAELRGACVRQGSSLTGEFLDLEREIDSFASQYELDIQLSSAMKQPIRKGKHAGLADQLALIEAKATALHEKAVERREFRRRRPADGGGGAAAAKNR